MAYGKITDKQREILEYINQNYYRNISLRELAENVRQAE